MRQLPDRHHILFDRAAWSSNFNARWLREESGLIVRIGRSAHNALHEAVSVVPLLNHDTAGHVRNLMRGSDATQPLDIADDFMSAVQETYRHARYSKLDRALGELVIASVEAQRDFIKDGITAAKVYDLGAPVKLHIVSADFEQDLQTA